MGNECPVHSSLLCAGSGVNLSEVPGPVSSGEEYPQPVSGGEEDHSLHCEFLVIIIALTSSV